MSNIHYSYKGTIWENKESGELCNILEDNNTFVMIESEKCVKTISFNELLNEYWRTT